MAASNPEEYDLLIVTDATASMGMFLRSLNNSLQDIIRISATTGCFSRIGVLAYRDYDSYSSSVTQWSGWHSRDADSEISQHALLSFVKAILPLGGDDWPEATKTSLAYAYELMRADAKTIILLYADAAPHVKHNSNPRMWQAEQDALSKPGAYGGNAALFADWTSAASALSIGEKRAQVFAIIEPGRGDTETTPFFTYLSTRTGGVCLAISGNASSALISKVTVGLLVAWMGLADKQNTTPESKDSATLVRFMDVSGIDRVASESDPEAARYLPAPQSQHREALVDNLTRSPLPVELMAQFIPRRERSVLDFAKRYRTDPEYRNLVVEQLDEILESEVSAIALNPVFGGLWRSVCNDRSNPARDGLITKFGLQVDKISDAEKKAHMKKWLEESYDMTGEVVEAIQSVPEEARYPCVFLDPTLRFAASEESADGEEVSMNFTRDELLEIGRSCDYRILRRLGRILTRLTYVNSEEELPAHIAGIPMDQVPRIPMALCRQEHQRMFWRVLLHTVLPGTMLAARPAALLAALSLRMGMKPLEDAAIAELLSMRNNWNTLDIPETWNTSCLTLLLEADMKHQKIMANSQASAAASPTILKTEDRRLFQALVDYKLLDMNLDTSLTAKIGWTPHKTRVALGPVLVCKTCHFPRSVTMMAENGVCGLCAVPESECTMEGGRRAMIHGNVAKSDDSTTQGAWSECSMTHCRAQYVVYFPEHLNVRPKCHYCRQKLKYRSSDPSYKRLTTAPCVTCTVCASRVIWPAEYRPSDFNPAEYKCPGCTNNKATITTQETTARMLASENGNAWLLRNDGGTIKEPFNHRSLFHTISTAAPTAEERAAFADKVAVLPGTEQLTLTMRGKPLHNTAEVVDVLHGWVSARRVQAGTCTLCFATHRKRDLGLACGGRKGCREPVCGDCARNWYGINRPGAVINIAALSCPFCRRQPTTKVDLPHNLRYLGGLKDAVNEAGTWVYAWCLGCSLAKRYVERVCAQGAPAEPGDEWRCEDCVTARMLAVEERGGKVQKPQEVKHCPGCDVATVKTFGCDHMSCPCGTHWCYRCGKNVGQELIYKHMSDEHSGWYDGMDYDETDDEYDY
ncbi:E3 ubiquitin-protein ligase itt1 [Madurella mycetomatis]|uniref:E3 ubiquitin-protein ligase itt1 n=1 Tax=Madurella mycetomatis TaxID=100816 RepID=A0A175WH98_9PEZI|nr:E3 ubiquitin-protein ligase itt1 [Madurella mycetomatis]